MSFYNKINKLLKYLQKTFYVILGIYKLKDYKRTFVIIFF
jgi:hypothetical protein